MPPEADDRQRIDALEALLAEAETAHGAYESIELNGVYDEEWPQWYAAYAVEHGIGALVDREIDPSELAETLAARWREFQATERAEPWARYIARRLAEGP